MRGDIITEFDGVTVKNQNELTARMEYYEVGETVEITIMQGSPNGYQPKQVMVTLSSYEELNEANRRQQTGNTDWGLGNTAGESGKAGGAADAR